MYPFFLFSPSPFFWYFLPPFFPCLFLFLFHNSLRHQSLGSLSFCFTWYILWGARCPASLSADLQPQRSCVSIAVSQSQLCQCPLGVYMIPSIWRTRAIRTAHLGVVMVASLGSGAMAFPCVPLDLMFISGPMTQHSALQVIGAAAPQSDVTLGWRWGPASLWSSTPGSAAWPGAPFAQGGTLRDMIGGLPHDISIHTPLIMATW